MVFNQVKQLILIFALQGLCFTVVEA